MNNLVERLVVAAEWAEVKLNEGEIKIITETVEKNIAELNMDIDEAINNEIKKIQDRNKGIANIEAFQKDFDKMVNKIREMEDEIRKIRSDILHTLDYDMEVMEKMLLGQQLKTLEITLNLTEETLRDFKHNKSYDMQEAIWKKYYNK